MGCIILILVRLAGVEPACLQLTFQRVRSARVYRHQCLKVVKRWLDSNQHFSYLRGCHPTFHVELNHAPRHRCQRNTIILHRSYLRLVNWMDSNHRLPLFPSDLVLNHEGRYALPTELQPDNFCVVGKVGFEPTQAKGRLIYSQVRLSNSPACPFKCCVLKRLVGRVGFEPTRLGTRF